MKKMLKRISTIVLALIVTLSNLVGVKAFDSSSITINKSISLPILVGGSSPNYVSVYGELKSDSAVVSTQYVVITEEQFKNIDAKLDEHNAYVKEQNEIIKEKNATLKTEKTKLDALKEIADKETATDEEKKAYTDAKAAYDANQQEATESSKNAQAQAQKMKLEYENLIPTYSDNNWKTSTLKEKTDSNNKYEFDYLNSAYYVLWVKVSVNGKDYYNYGLYCNKVEEKKYCEISDGKYYNSEGKEVTEAEYKADCEVEEKKYCEISDGKYYNSEGKEVTEAEYKADCEEPELYVCEINDGKYYNSEGKEVTEAEYKADCEKVVINVCRIVDGKYYDNNGKEVTKAEYEKACTVPSNPKTGLNNNILYGLLITLVAGSSYAVVRKARKFSR